MSVQTSYDACGVAYEGLITDCNPNDVVTGLVETAAGIHFGRAVSRGTADTQIVIGGDGTFYGVTGRTHENPNPTDPADYEISAECEAVPVLLEGYIWVLCVTAASAGAALHYTDVTGVIDTGAAGGGETTLPGETMTDNAANSLVKIRVRRA